MPSASISNSTVIHGDEYYLKIALGLLSIVCVALALIDLRTIRTFQNFRPLVIRIDDLAEPRHQLPQPRIQAPDAEAKYFSRSFAPVLRHNRYTIQDDFRSPSTSSTASLPTAFSTPTARTTSLRNSSQTPQRPRLISMSKRLRSKSCKRAFRARVDFYMVYYSPADHSELKRDLYTANFVFLFKSQVPNELIPINPLGMSITYFREDQAFK